MNEAKAKLHEKPTLSAAKTRTRENNEERKNHKIISVWMGKVESPRINISRDVNGVASRESLCTPPHRMHHCEAGP